MSIVNKKAQSWSIDLVLGLVIFVLILSVFYMLLSKDDSANVIVMKSSGNKVMNMVDSKSSNTLNSFVDGNNVNMSKLEEFYKTENYEAIRKELGLKGDFCIILEDKNGNVISIMNSTKRIYGFGSEDINISGCPCGQSCNIP